MKRKEKILFLHESSTNEKLHCLSGSLQWAKLLIGKGQKYDQFLQGLCEKNFFKDVERISVTKIAADLGFKSTHITKWIAQIYEDIYELNDTEPELFKTSGLRHDCYFKSYDNETVLSIWLPQTPKEFERFEFYFVKAKIGTAYFWVKNVTHLFENAEYSVHLELVGEKLNKYRDSLVDRALFENVLNSFFIYDHTEGEIDEVLKKHYR